MSENPSNQGIPIWKRPWTLDEMRLGASSWSLASDAGLYLFMEKMAEELKTSTSNVEQDVLGVIRDSKEINVQIQNAFNDFCMLANNQFIENLVEDDSSNLQDVKNNEESKPSKTKEEKQAELMPFVKQSLHLGLKVLETQYERVEVKTDRSWNEDDDDLELNPHSDPGDASTNGLVTIEPIYEPRDPYENRHLPHLIGSSAFKDDDTLGIGFIDDDDLEEVPEEDEPTDEEDDESLSEEEMRKRKSSRFSSVSSFTSSSSSDLESQKLKSTKTELADKKKETHDDNFFGDSDSESDMSDSFDDALSSSDKRKSKRSNADETKSAPPNNLADELKRKLAPSLTRADSPQLSEGSQSPSLLPSHKTKSRSATRSSKPPSHPPPPQDQESSDDDDLFGGKTSLFNPKSTLFTPASNVKSSGLFDDDEEENEDDFKIPPPKTASQPKNKNETSQKFPVDEDDLFAQVAKSQKQQKAANDLSDDNEDLFVPKSTSKPSPQSNVKTVPTPAQTTKKVAPGIFSDDEDDLFAAAKPKKKPIDNVTKAPESNQKSKTTSQFSTTDEDDDLFSALPKKTSVSKPNETNNDQQPPQRKKPAGAVSMFGGVDPFALTRNSITGNKESDEIPRSLTADSISSVGKAETGYTDPIKPSEIPDRTQPGNSFLASQLPKRSTFSSDDSEEDDDLFAQKKPAASAVKSNVLANKTSSSNDKQDDLFADSKSNQPPIAFQAPSNQGDLLSKENDTPSLNQSKVSNKPPSKAIDQKSKLTKDIFSDDDDDDDDLFSAPQKTKKTPPKSQPTITPPMATQIYKAKDDDDDDLFGSQEKKPTVIGGPKADSIKDDSGDNLFTPHVQKPVTKPAPTTGDLDNKQVKDFFAPVKPAETDSAQNLLKTDSTDDEDDLFAVSKKSKSSADNKAIQSSSVNPLGDVDSIVITSIDQRKFTDSSKPVEQPVATSKPSFKPPPGAVPMFGGGPGSMMSAPVGIKSTTKQAGAGMSLAKEMKAKLKARAGLDPNAPSSSSSSDENETEKSDERQSSGKVFVPPPGAVSMFGGPPLAGLPRKSEKPNEPELGVNFDSPVTSNDDKVLTSATKVRPRPSMNRKRPSRFATSAKGADSQTSNSTEDTPGSGLDIFAGVTGNESSEKSKKDDIFEDIPPAKNSSTAENSEAPNGFDSNNRTEDDNSTVDRKTSFGLNDDIFSNLKVPKKLGEDNEDIFASISTSKDANQKGSKPDDEHIFASMKSKDDQHRAGVISDEEDIFESAKSNTKSHSTDFTDKLKKQNADEEDIFSVTKTKKEEKPYKASLHLDSDEEDLFDTARKSGRKSAVSKTTASETKTQKKANADRLFADDTDIFADLPAITKSKASKTAGAGNRKKSNPPPVVTEDIDDIFATPRSSSSTTKKKTKKSQDTVKPKAMPVNQDPLGPLG